MFRHVKEMFFESHMDVDDYHLEHSAVVSCKSGSMKFLQHFYIFKRKLI